MGFRNLRLGHLGRPPVEWGKGNRSDRRAAARVDRAARSDTEKRYSWFLYRATRERAFRPIRLEQSGPIENRPTAPFPRRARVHATARYARRRCRGRARPFTTDLPGALARFVRAVRGPAVTEEPCSRCKDMDSRAPSSGSSRSLGCSAVPTPSPFPMTSRCEATRKCGPVSCRRAAIRWRRDRPMLLEFSAPWCTDCQLLNTLKQRGALRRELARWPRVVVNVDQFDHNVAYLEAFGVERIAHWAVLSPEDCEAPAGSWTRLAQLTVEPKSGAARGVSAGELAEWLAAFRKGGGQRGSSRGLALTRTTRAPRIMPACVDQDSGAPSSSMTTSVPAHFSAVGLKRSKTDARRAGSSSIARA